jgi:prophage regulatory protein
MKAVPSDIIEHLEIDAGQRTIGQLIQDRERALQEIRRLRALTSPSASNRNSGVSQVAAKSVIQTPAMQVDKLIRLAELCKLLDMERSTIYKLKSEGHFPEPIKIGDRAVRWRLSDIQTWQDTRAISRAP